MKSLSRIDAADWCTSHGVALDDRGRPAKPAHASSFVIPADTGARIALVVGDLRLFEGRSELLFWITDWSVWPSGERPHIFDRLRASYGEMASVKEVPAHVFSAVDYEDAVSFATLTVLFLWDVFLVSPGGRPMLHYSHDEHGWLLE